MQTPKEKAKELYDSFIKLLEINDMRSGANPFAKKCAEYCTEEIIRELYDQGIREPQYWYDVQKELDLL